MNPFRWAVLGIGVLGLTLIFIDHLVHALGILPYLVLLACPLMHIFHRHHGGYKPRGITVKGMEETP